MFDRKFQILDSFVNILFNNISTIIIHLCQKFSGFHMSIVCTFMKILDGLIKFFQQIARIFIFEFLLLLLVLTHFFFFFDSPSKKRFRIVYLFYFIFFFKY